MKPNNSNFATDGKQKVFILGLILVLAATTLILYSPSLSQPPLFDESFIMAWLSHCLKTGLTTSDTTAFLLAAAADPRDGLTPLGSGYVLLMALLTGSSYSIMRFLQVLLHLSNALLLFVAVNEATISAGTTNDTPTYTDTVNSATSLISTADGAHNSAITTNGMPNSVSTANETALDHGRDQTKDQGGNLKLGQPVNIRTFALAAVSALYFCLFPLAPEAVAWLFGLPIELATASMLCATVILLRHHKSSSHNRNRLVIFATVLGMLAPWISLTGALLVNLPIVLILAARGVKNLISDTQLRPVLVSLALMVVSSLPAEIISCTQHKAIPETILQLTIEKIALTGDNEASRNSLLGNGQEANIQAIVLPVNRNIDDKYNKALRLLFLFLPLPVVLFLLATLTNPRFRVLSVATVLAVLVCTISSAAAINGQNFYGARWLYPLLPTACLLWAMICISPLFVDSGKRHSNNGETAEIIIKIGLCVIFVFSLSIFFFQRTFRQNQSFRSNGKLWKVIKESITIAGQKQTSPFIIVRNLPQSLSVAPILSPFSPQLLDSQSGLPRSTSLSAGRLKDALRSGKYGAVTLHYEKQYEGFAATDLAIVDQAFCPKLNAQQIASQLAPPLMYYNGAIKLDEKGEALLMESHTRVGPALRMKCYGLSPIDGDFLFVEAKIDVPPAARTNGPANLELHWLTNWQDDWEARDRKVLTSGPVSDGQFHSYYFPLRTLAWTTNGLPTNLMLGFPGGATVAIKSIGLCQEKVPLPYISIAAVHKQNTNKNYFSHFCFNYPDLDELGLSAVYGHDNAIDISFDVSKIPGAKEAVIEIVPLSEAFRNENSSAPLEGSLIIRSRSITGSIKVPSEQLSGGGLFSIRVFAASEDHKIVGHSSDSLKCLVDQRL